MRRSSKRLVKTVLTSLALFATFGMITFFKYKNDLVSKAERLEASNEDWTYKQSQLKKWKPAPRIVWTHNHSGQDGSAVIIPKDKIDLADKLYKINQFNLLASDMVPLNRSLQDFREDECKTKKYPECLPTTSVIIVFHNEAWSTLLRTVWSVINRSSKELLTEIILVDDSSDQDHLKAPLDNYVALLPVPVHVLRTGQRLGLIKARLIGAEYSKGQVLTFLDAHCECSEGWLEPLLARIAENRKAVVVPTIDTISRDNFGYKKSNNKKGIFTPAFVFSWLQLTKEEEKEVGKDRTKPFQTPAIIGGLLSIDRQYFYESGSYDEAMSIWGGENIEMSLRIWQCGGSLETSICSRVGHVYRNVSPHNFPGGVTKTIDTNLNRVYEVWLDEWMHYVRALYPKSILPAGDVSKRMQLRRDLKCKSFGWYLDKIFPESAMRETPLYLTSIKNEESNMCIDILNDKAGHDIGLYSCNHGYHQRFIFSKRGEIKVHTSCLDGFRKNPGIKLYKCHNLKGNQEWVYNDKDKTIKHVPTGQCIEAFINVTRKRPVLGVCNPRNPLQKWIVKNDYSWHKYLFLK